MTTGSETDPNGLGQHEAGAKLDAGKPLPATVLGSFGRVLKSVTLVGTHGAKKYSKHGWLHVPNGEDRYYEAFFRHLLDYMTGEWVDKESSMPHIDHAIWNLLALRELQLRGQEYAEDAKLDNFHEEQRLKRFHEDVELGNL